MPSPGDAGQCAALDDLLRALDLEALGGDRFRAGSESPRFPRVFGGQLVAQALHAAGATVEERHAHSVHAYFVQGGISDRPLDIAVQRVRDGRLLATRQVTVSQGERTVLVALASFHADAPAPEQAASGAVTAGPDELPTLQEWARRAPEHLREGARVWIERPPPLDIRIGEAPTFLGGGHALGTRAHWLRLPRAVGDDPALHAVLLTYASDYFLTDMATRSDRTRTKEGGSGSSSVDHAVWLHRPVRFDRWHRYTQETAALAGHRGLVRGSIHDEAGSLVATVAQEVLLAPTSGAT
jgi:acyl-CoA thioesterase-2